MNDRTIRRVRFRLGYVAALSVLAGCTQAAAITHIRNLVGAEPEPAAVVTAVNLSHHELEQVPVTFGQPFRQGNIPARDTVVAYLNGDQLPTQADIKARNPDGSARHAVLTILLPRLASQAAETLSLHAVPDSMHPEMNRVTLGDVLRTSFDANARFMISGVPWHLDARALMQQVQHQRLCKPFGRQCNIWLSGPLVSEWIIGGPIVDAAGHTNRHLAVYFAIRAYGPVPVKRIRLDVIVENDWAYVSDPHNTTYNATIDISGKRKYAVHDLDHYRQARWHQVFWWGAADPVYAQLSSKYLQYSRAVPRYEVLHPSASFLRSVRQSCPPMQSCDQTPYMANTGAQAAIGPLARWSSVYVIDPTYRAYRWMLANSDALGAYGIHYRDEITGQPVSLEAHPCMTLIGPAEVIHCPVPPHKNDIFPRCKRECRTPLYPDEPHHPEPAYVAYLVTGDYYYLEELEFWADWVVFHQNPAYRGYAKGLIEDTQVRGQAWGLRTLGYAAYILPDHDPLKSYLNGVVENNIRWYNKTYTDNPKANALHVLANGYAIGYPNHGNAHTGMATWQQSFFNWAVGNLADLGFRGANRLRDWLALFQVNLMTSPEFCWIVASDYQLQVRSSENTPIYASLRNVYAASFPELQHLTCDSDQMAAHLSVPHGYRYARGVMVGYPKSPTGFVANFQIGLAAAADSDVAHARQAWTRFAERRAQPAYADSPNLRLSRDANAIDDARQ